MGLVIPFVKLYIKRIDSFLHQLNLDSDIEYSNFLTITSLIQKATQSDFLSPLDQIKLGKVLLAIAERLPNNSPLKIIKPLIQSIENLISKDLLATESFFTIIIAFGYLIQKIYESKTAHHLHMTVCKILHILFKKSDISLLPIASRILFEALHQCSVVIDSASFDLLSDIFLSCMSITDEKVRSQISMAFAHFTKKAPASLKTKDIETLIELGQKILLWKSSNIESIALFATNIATRLDASDELLCEKFVSLLWRLLLLSHQHPKILLYVFRLISDAVKKCAFQMKDKSLITMLDLLIVAMQMNNSDDKMPSIIALGSLVQRLPSNLSRELNDKVLRVIETIENMDLHKEAKLFAIIAVIEMLRKVY